MAKSADEWEAKYKALASDARDPAALAAAEGIVRRAAALAAENHLPIAANVQMLVFAAQAKDLPVISRLPAELVKWQWGVERGWVRATPKRQ